MASPRGYTAPQMKAGRAVRGAEQRGSRGLPRRALLLAGSSWEVVRFFLVLLLLALLIETAAGTGPWIFPWLLFAGSGNLLVAAGCILVAALPDRYGSLIGLLRLGKAISVFAFVLLVVSGALGVVVDREVFSAGPVVVTVGPVMFGVFALDLLFLAGLVGLRGGPAGPAPGGEPAGLAENKAAPPLSG